MTSTLGLRTFDHDDFAIATLCERKGDTTVSVCLPARNEEATVGSIVADLVSGVVEAHPLVDEILVVDDHSEDRTAELARSAGARVVSAAEILPSYGRGHGKGEALWKSVFASGGDIVLWCDADIRNFGIRFVVGLLGPLLHHPELSFVKGFYDRPVVGSTAGGGRNTELVARPLISLLFPELSGFVQPLSGEYGGRRELLEHLAFVQGYGVDLAMLIDVSRTIGIDGMAQVDLGSRVHRNRRLDELSVQSTGVMAAALGRVVPELVSELPILNRPGYPPVVVPTGERPPLAGLPEYLDRPDRQAT